MPVSVGSSIGNETAKRHDGRDGGSRAARHRLGQRADGGRACGGTGRGGRSRPAGTRGGAAGHRRATDGGELIEQGLTRRVKRFLLLVVVPAVMLGVNVPPAWAWISELRHQQLINSQEYKEQFGKWDVVDLPDDQKVNAIHAAVLPTGRILLIAGSGNKEDMFNAGTFKSLIYDPATGRSRVIPTPDDMFCAGHTFLGNGNLLIAGGTQRYERLDGAVVNAAGGVTVKNEDPDAAPRTFPAGTEFLSPEGLVYRAGHSFTVQPANKVATRRGATVTASETIVFAEAVAPGPQYVAVGPKQYTVGGAHPRRGAEHLRPRPGDDHGEAGLPGHRADLRVQPVHGVLRARRGHDLQALVPDADARSRTAASSRSPASTAPARSSTGRTRSTTRPPGAGPSARTSPSTSRPTRRCSRPRGRTSCSTPGRTPGTARRSSAASRASGTSRTTCFSPIPGMRDPDLLETAGSAWVGPVQDQRIAVVGGGGVGESPRSSARIDTIDLDEPEPDVDAGADRCPRARATRT